MQTKARRTFLHTYRLVLWIVLIVILIPMLGAAVYNRPFTDDYAQGLSTRMAYQQTGSLWQAVLAAMRAAYGSYITRSGIFFSMFLSALCPSFMDYHLVTVTAMLMPLLMVATVFYACSCLFVLGQGVPKAAVHCVALLISICLFMFMPDTTEAFYWYSGMINYTFMITWALLLFAMLFKACHMNRRGTGQIVVGCCMAFLLGGANHLTATASIALYLFFMAYIFIAHKPKQYILPFLFLMAGYIIVLLCPGNESRQLGVGTQLSLPHAFISSFLEAARYLFSDARWWISLLLFIPVVLEIVPKLTLSFRWSWMVPLVSVSLLAAHYFPLIYTGYYIAGRHRNVFFIITILLLASNLLALMGFLYKRFNLRNNMEAVPLPRWLMLFAVTSLILMLSVGPIEIECDLPPVNMTVQLLRGEMAQYAEEYDALVEKIRANPGGAILISEVPENEFLGSPDLRPFPGHWINSSFAISHGGPGTTLAFP